MKKMNDLIPANRDPNVLIKEKAKHCIHVRLTKTNFNPRNPRVQSTRELIQVFTPEEFEKMEAQKYAKQAFDWKTVSGFDEATVVHDGRLVAKDEKANEVEPEMAAVQDVVKEEVKKAVRKQKALKNIKDALNKAK